MQKVKRVCEGIAKAFNYVSLCLIFFATAITVVNVISRSVFKAPIFGVTELVQYSTLGAVSLAAAYGTLRNTHPKVEILIDALKPRAKNAFAIFTNILTVVFFGLFGWKLWPIMTEMIFSHRTTESLFIPYWIINAFVELCMITVFIVEIILCVEHIYLLKKGKNDFDEIENDKEEK